MKTTCFGSAVAPLLALVLLCHMPVNARAQVAIDSVDGLLLAATPIRYGEEAFLARIQARTGGLRTPVGLVLSGGSARAFAHIGVLRRLEEAGIVPDFIVANSMGSIIGLLYAAGLSPGQIYQLVSSTDLGRLFEPVLPLGGGILDPGRFSDLIRLYLGDLRLEDLPIPILVACEDLKTKRAIGWNIAMIGEAMSRILKQHPEITITNARKIVDTRNRITHGYDTVSDDIIWSIVINDLPKLEEEVNRLMAG